MKKIFTFLMMLALCQALNGQTYFGPVYTHLNSSSNCYGDYTLLDVATVGYNPADNLIFTHNYGPDFYHQTYMLQNHGLWNTGTEWSIFNETGNVIDEMLAFNVLNAKENCVHFTHTVTVDNSILNWTVLDNPSINGNPGAIFFISKSWDNGIYDTSHVGVWYDGANWTIYNEDATTPLALNSTYNVVIPSTGSYFKHLTTENEYITVIDNSLINGDPNAKIFVAHDWTTNESYVNDEVGVWYNGTNWTIYNENVAHPFDISTGFNVLIANEYGVGVNEINNGKLALAPNPARGSVSLTLPSAASGIIRITDQTGKTCITKETSGSTKMMIDLTDLSAGIYFVNYTSETNTFTSKMVVY